MEFVELLLNGMVVLRGILIIWDNKVVEKTDESMGEFMVAISFENVEDSYQ